MGIMQIYAWCYLTQIPSVLDALDAFVTYAIPMIAVGCMAVPLSFLLKTNNEVRRCYFFNIGIFVIHFSWHYFGILSLQECLRISIFFQWYLNSNTVKMYEFRKKYQHPWLLLLWCFAVPILKHIHPLLYVLVPIHITIVELLGMY